MLKAVNISKNHTFKKRTGLFQYEKQIKKAIVNVNLSLPKGKIIGVLGENGAGKTTLIKMLTTLLTNDTGIILIDGVDINENLKNTRKKINIISGGEKNLYWRLTAVENLIYFASLYGISKREALPKIEKLLIELGLWDSKDIPVEKYSKGMKQRLQIAKGLINDPEYLFLDEPTLGLDVSVAHELRKKLKEIAIKRNTGILLTTHYMAEAEELCDYIYFLKKGKIIISGTKDEVFDKLKLSPEIHITLAPQFQWNSMEIKRLRDLFPALEYRKEENLTLIKFSLLKYKVQSVIKTIYESNIDIIEIKHTEPSLEDVVLHLGRR